MSLTGVESNDFNAFTPCPRQLNPLLATGDHGLPVFGGQLRPLHVWCINFATHYIWYVNLTNTSICSGAALYK